MLYSIEEFPDIYVDACLRDSDGRLMFMSAYGRDGVLMQMLSAFELGVSGGVRTFYLANAGGERHRVDVGDTKRLGKFAGKLPRDNLFGAGLNQVWVYDKALQSVDWANRIGYVVKPKAYESSPVDSADAWPLIKRLSPVALQEHWRSTLIKWCLSKGALRWVGDNDLYPALGAICAYRVSLSEHFVDFISEAVRERRLTLSA